MSWRQYLVDLLTGGDDNKIVCTDSRIRNIQIPKEDFTDLDDNDHVSKYQVSQVIQPIIDPILIPAGSVPTTLVNGVDFNTALTIPFVLQVANPTYPTVDDTKLSTEGQSLRTDYQYTDNTLTMLVSIDVWVIDNTVDTWVRIF